MAAHTAREEDLAPEQRRRLAAYRRRARVVAACLAGTVVLIEAVFVLVVRSRAVEPRHPVALVVLLVLVPVVSGCLIALLPRLTLRRPETRALVANADRRDIVRVRRVLSRGDEVAERDRPTAQAVVDVNARTTTSVLLVLVGTVLFALGALVAHRWIVWLYLVVLLVIGPYALISQRRLLANGERQGLVPRDRSGRG